ncbi:MAG: hypothetical protein IPP42_06915 [Saprospiraceae bacterium]|nr:hypothetical protein [Saprospiraceae bacterium]
MHCKIVFPGYLRSTDHPYAWADSKALYHYQDARDGFSIVAASTDYKAQLTLSWPGLMPWIKLMIVHYLGAMRSTEFIAKNIEALQLLGPIHR